MRCQEIEEDSKRPEHGELHELPCTEMVKSTTIRLASVHHLISYLYICAILYALDIHEYVKKEKIKRET